jgi:hypothetical protein
MSEQDPCAEGREAYLEGTELNCCPYPPDSAEAVEWEGCWMEAEEEAAGDE